MSSMYSYNIHGCFEFLLIHPLNLERDQLLLLLHIFIYTRSAVMWCLTYCKCYTVSKTPRLRPLLVMILTCVTLTLCTEWKNSPLPPTLPYHVEVTSPPHSYLTVGTPLPGSPLLHFISLKTKCATSTLPSPYPAHNHKYTVTHSPVIVKDSKRLEDNFSLFMAITATMVQSSTKVLLI